MEREIKFYSTLGGGIQTITSSATTWGQLKEEIDGTIQIEGMSATESINKRDLVENVAELPNVPFIIFLRQSKTNQGISFDSMSYSEVMTFLKNNPELKAVIKEETGINFTNCPLVRIKEVLNAHYRSYVVNTTTISEAPQNTLNEASTEFNSDTIKENLLIIRRNLQNLVDELDTLLKQKTSLTDAEVMDLYNEIFLG